MEAELRLGALAPEHRSRVADIVRATGVFRDEEVGVALEVFDEAMLAAETRALSSESRRLDDDYHVLGLFSTRHSALSSLLVGFAAYGPTPNTDRTYDLYWIAIDPCAQGSGAGTMLLNGVEDAMRDRDARLAVVETSSRSEYDGTRRFYARRGYAEVARMREFYAPADDRIIYTKRMAAPVSGHGVAE